MEIYENWKNESMNSKKQQDVIQLRKRLNEIQIFTENELQSYNMNSADDADLKR